MNTTQSSSLKLLICLTVSLLLTSVVSWSFVQSTAMARWVAAPNTQLVRDTVQRVGFDVPRAGVSLIRAAGQPAVFC